MASQDSLSLLRDFTINKKPVQFLDDSGQVTTELKQATEISFAETKFPKTTITKYKKSGSEEFYTLDTLVFLVQNISLDYGSLLKESLSAGIPTVSYIDRKDLLDYLTGVIETSPNVVTENAKRPPEESKKEIEDTTKKAKTSTSATDPSNDSEFSRKLKVRERELNTKETILKGTRSFSFIQKKAAAMIKDIEKELVELKKPEGAKDPKNGSNGRERPSHPGTLPNNSSWILLYILNSVYSSWSFDYATLQFFSWSEII
ncbi:accessory factor associated with RNA polymerase II, variant 2 [Basidiobolus ranarum]|uniref:Accessory factor associated with RNA polymerase II, variant 2 n=1 Tax=Basidiobolus ranarum TaxID=34480 RepID=A0ABR2W0X4_9FUNG